MSVRLLAKLNFTTGCHGPSMSPLTGRRQDCGKTMGLQEEYKTMVRRQDCKTSQEASRKGALKDPPVKGVRKGRRASCFCSGKRWEGFFREKSPANSSEHNLHQHTLHEKTCARKIAPDNTIVSFLVARRWEAAFLCSRRSLQKVCADTF